MTLPSASLLAQSVLSGVFIGALYGLLGLGLSLSWGLLRQINLALFAFAFLAAYVCYQLAQQGMDPLVTLVVIVPAFFALGALLQALLARFAITPFNSLLVTFGITGIVEALIQSIWTADFRKLESSYGEHRWKLAGLYVPLPELITLLFSAGLAFAVWAVLRYTYFGKAVRAASQEPSMAAAFGINHRANALLIAGLCAASAAVAGIFIALTTTLAPSQMFAWFGVVFAVVIIGGLGNPLGALVAGVLIGIAESMTMALIAPAWAPIVSFSLLIALLIWQPRWL